MTHIVLPVQFSNCVAAVKGAVTCLARVNLLQTLMTFDGEVDAGIEFSSDGSPAIGAAFRMA
jgi:hypothetical protein